MQLGPNVPVPKTFPQLQVRGTEGGAHRNLWKGNEIMVDSGLRKSKAYGRIERLGRGVSMILLAVIMEDEPHSGTSLPSSKSS